MPTLGSIVSRNVLHDIGTVQFGILSATSLGLGTTPPALSMYVTVRLDVLSVPLVGVGVAKLIMANHPAREKRSSATNKRGLSAPDWETELLFIGVWRWRGPHLCSNCRLTSCSVYKLPQGQCQWFGQRRGQPRYNYRPGE